MDDLNFPIIKTRLSDPQALSMDEYDKFIQFNLKNFFNRQAYEEWKKISVVNVPFVIK